MFVNLVKQQDRTFTLETIEKMKQPKSIQHKKKISKSITNWWEERKNEKTMALIDSKQLNPNFSGSFAINTGSTFRVSGSDDPTTGDFVLSTSGSINTTGTGRVFEQGTSVVDTVLLPIVFGG